MLVRIRSSEEMKGVVEGLEPGGKIKDRLSKNPWSSKLVSQQLSHLFNGYTQAINKKYDRTGSLFERSFKRKDINEESYFCNLVTYIHRNPELHGFVNDFKQYPYSSYQIYFSKKESRINKAETLERFGGIDNFKVAHVESMEVPEEYILE